MRWVGARPCRRCVGARRCGGGGGEGGWAAGGGGVAVQVASDLLDESRPGRAAVLSPLIARAARNRNAQEELLKLYDPLAHEVFYTEKGMATERKIGAVLKWKEWPPLYQAVAIRACPRFTRDWILERASDSSE